MSTEILGGDDTLRIPERWVEDYRAVRHHVEHARRLYNSLTPNALVATINHERMPVLLADAAAQDAWLNGTSAEAFALARRYPPEAMRIVQAGFDKKDLLAATA